MDSCSKISQFIEILTQIEIFFIKKYISIIFLNIFNINTLKQLKNQIIKKQLSKSFPNNLLDFNPSKKNQ
jgi:hypothetical protein